MADLLKIDEIAEISGALKENKAAAIKFISKIHENGIMTKAALASAMGIYPSEIKQIETGKMPVTTEKVIRCIDNLTEYCKENAVLGISNN